MKKYFFPFLLLLVCIRMRFSEIKKTPEGQTSVMKKMKDTNQFPLFASFSQFPANSEYGLRKYDKLFHQMSKDILLLLFS